jgi:hypothetical protein
MGDTHPNAAAVQLDVLRRLSPAARLELAFDMSQLARALLRRRLQGEHPTWSSPELDREVLRHTLQPAALPEPLR